MAKSQDSTAQADQKSSADEDVKDESPLKPKADNRPAPEPPAKPEVVPTPPSGKRFLITPPGGEAREIEADTVQDAIRILNGDGRGKVFTFKQCQIKEL